MLQYFSFILGFTNELAYGFRESAQHTLKELLAGHLGWKVQSDIRKLALSSSIFLLLFQDGRIWKERITSATTRAMADLPVLENGSCLQSQDGGEESLLNPAKCPISSSLSVPKHNIDGLLGECIAPEDRALN